MNITQFAIEKNRITIVLLIILVLGGFGAYFNLSQAEDPGFTVRTALVQTYFPGASPERVELLVTDKIEKVIQEIPELDSISSSSRTGLSIIYVNIKEEYKNMRPIWDKLRRKVDKVKSSLPDGIYGPEVNDEFGDVFGQIITITGEGFSYAELKAVADDVRDELLRIEDVAKVEIYGAQEEKIFVEYNNARLAEIGMPPALLADILKSTNIINPGGDISTGFERIVLEPSGSFQSMEELKRTIIQVPASGKVMFLEDLAKVRRGYIEPPRSKMRSTGIDCLGLAISMREGGKIVQLGKRIKRAIRHLQGLYPIGIEFDFIAFQPADVHKIVNDFMNNLIQAVVIVIIVMLITLGIRTGLVVATLIPMAILMTFLIMGIFDKGLNQVSLASLIIALGLLVDNAIVMSESIMVRRQNGEDPKTAAINSANELKIPLLTSSLTTCAAFLPFFMAKSSMGEYVGDLFVVVSFTLLSSWILAITIIPLFCVYLLKPKSGKIEFNSKFYVLYRRIIVFMLKHRIMTMICVCVFFSLSIYGLKWVPKIFMPQSDNPIMTVELPLPIGTPIEKTEKMFTQLESFLLENKMMEKNGEGMINWATFIGEGAPRFKLPYNPQPPAAEYGMMVMNTSSFDIINSKLIPEIESFCFENFHDVVPKVRTIKLGPSSGYPIEIRIVGKDKNVLFHLGKKVKEQLEAIPGVKNISDNWGRQTKKLQVNINQVRARKAGLSSQDVAISLMASLSGLETTQYREDDKVIPVMLQSISAERSDIGKLESLNIFSNSTGHSVPLKQVADIEVVWQPPKILRKDRLKSITIQADVQPDTPAMSVTQQLDQWLSVASKSWKPGYRYEVGGESENSAEANKALVQQLPLAAFIILVLLVSQFNSLRRPAIILITIPLGMIGVTVGLLVMKSYFGFMTLLGIISLSGIVINNAIVLLDRIRIEITDNGLDPRQAVIEAAQQRLRPILLTTATTIGGLIPLYLSGGPMWKPMSITIVFGILFSTSLTLGVVPVLYSLFFRLSFKDVSA